MRRLAVVADKRLEFDANIAIAKFLLRATIGANAVARKSSQLSNFLFRVGERHGVQWRDLQGYSKDDDDSGLRPMTSCFRADYWLYFC
jgi:hypothetical protein